MTDQTDRQVSRLVRLVDDMLDIARICSGRLTIERERVDLCQLVKEVANRTKAQFINSSAQFPDAKICESAVGYWDRMRLEQVINNLFTNAIRYGLGGPIEIKVHAGERAVQLIVKDQGIGIPRENLTKVFDRYVRVVNASKESGLGLGLFITKKIVVAHGGRIWCESEFGKDATFIVELPRNMEAEDRAGEVEALHVV